MYKPPNLCRSHKSDCNDVISSIYANIGNIPKCLEGINHHLRIWDLTLWSSEKKWRLLNKINLNFITKALLPCLSDSESTSCMPWTSIVWQLKCSHINAAINKKYLRLVRSRIDTGFFCKVVNPSFHRYYNLKCNG